MEMNTHFLTHYSHHFIESRGRSAERFSYGNGSLLTGMIAGAAAGIRRAAATVEGWARGTGADAVDYRVPGIKTVR